jgi:glycosyltransferase involved in cell wall biosynthesis
VSAASARSRGLRIAYVANVRLPTEKAHGLQIVQNCEALAEAGAEVTLLAPRRVNTPALRGGDPWAHYGVARNFEVRRVPCLDLFPLGRALEPLAFPIQLATFVLFAAAEVRRRRPDVCLSRDLPTLLAMSHVLPARALVYEAHQLASSRIGRWIERRTLRRVGLVVAVTAHLARALAERGVPPVLVAHDGFRPARFAALPTRAAARAALGLPPRDFIVGYAGQLQTLSLSKGLDVLVEASARVMGGPVTLCVVGGPADMVARLRAQWQARGLAPERFLASGQIEPAAVPRWLAAFDVGVMPFPWTEHFAYSASPLKLFEYMAAGATVLASDLPATAEVVRDGETALLVPPGDAGALASGLARLRDDADLRRRLADAARSEVAAYSWPARAGRILGAIREMQAGPSTPAVLSIGLTSFGRPLGATTRKKFESLAALARFHVLGFSSDGRRLRFEEGARFDLVPRPRRAGRRFAAILWHALWSGRQVCRREAVQVVVCEDPYVGMAGLALRRFAAWRGRRLLVLVEAHGDWLEALGHYVALPAWARPALRRWTAFVLRRADLLRAVSDFTAERMRAASGRSDQPLFVFPTYTDVELFLAPPAGTEGRAAADPVVLFAGGLIPVKGLVVLLDAFAELRRRGARASLRLAGEGPLRPGLVDRARALGIEDRVHLLGALSQERLRDEMRAARVLVLPSLSEGLGRVVVEAMACGIPVVASRTGGLRELVRDGETGFLVEPGDAAALAGRLGWMLDHPDEAAEMGRRGRAWVERTFSTERYVEGYRRVLAAAAERLGG